MMPADVPTITLDAIPPGAVLLDVREDDEWAAGHIDTAVHVPMNQVPQRVTYDPGPITADASLVVLCKSGGRSAQVTAWLRQQGYDAVNLDGGMLAWARAGRPMASETGAPPAVL